MSGITCRNGLVWQGRRARFVFVAAIGLGLMVTSARGGSLDAPAGPMDQASAMWTLKDIYDVLDTRTTNVAKRTAFREPSAGPTVGTMHNLNDIMTLVTNRMPVGKTGQTTSYATDDDGALKIGVAWPAERFTVQANTNCILDNATGLIWARNANMFGVTNWGAAVTNCNNLDYGGQTDWRLPNVEELHSLIAWQYSSPALSDGTGTNKWTAALGPFASVQSGYYWSGTALAGNADFARNVNLASGDVSSAAKVTAYSVWPVRGGQ